MLGIMNTKVMCFN